MAPDRASTVQVMPVSSEPERWVSIFDQGTACNSNGIDIWMMSFKNSYMEGVCAD